MVFLRDFVTGDASALAKISNNPKVAQFMDESFPSPYNRYDADSWIRSASSLGVHKALVVETKALTRLGIASTLLDVPESRLHEATVLIGCIGATPQSTSRRHTAEVGYWVGEEFWGHGFASQALNDFASYLFKNYPFTRLSARVYGQNIASMRVLEKAGFEQEGILRGAVLCRGTVFDDHLYGRLK